MCFKALLACLGHRAGFIPSKTQGSLGHKRGWKRVWMTQGKSAPLGKQSSKTLCTYGIASAQRQSWSTHTRDKACGQHPLPDSLYFCRKEGTSHLSPRREQNWRHTSGSFLHSPHLNLLCFLCFSQDTSLHPCIWIRGSGKGGRKEVSYRTL